MQQSDLLKNIFGDQPHEKISEATRNFPYYSTAHYFMLRSSVANDTSYNDIVAKTALHFNNPFYLDFLLKNDRLGVQGLSIFDGENSEASTSETQQVIVDKSSPDIAVNPVPEPADNISNEKQLPTVTDEPEQLIFEPLYTTDYFASQGIKISDEVKPDDKLGKQLRSFTDWLKTMKKLHEQKLPAGNEQLDATVQHIAEKSNSDAEVITESMADVYVSQGKTGRALEVYRKLSLLNPAKSAYFAAKIESLKDN